MRKKITKIAVIFSLGMAVVGFQLGGASGCGSSPGAGVPTGGIAPIGSGTGSASLDTYTTYDKAFGKMGDVILDLFGSDQPQISAGLGTQSALKTQSSPYSKTFACDPSNDAGKNSVKSEGTVDLSDPSGGTFVLGLTYSDCDGVTGSLAMDGSSSVDSNHSSTVQVSLDGNIAGNGCSVSISDLKTTAVFTDIQGDVTGTVSGRVTGTCTENGNTANVVCQWSAVDLNDKTAQKNACSCSGAGCS